MPIKVSIKKMPRTKYPTDKYTVIFNNPVSAEAIEAWFGPLPPDEGWIENVPSLNFTDRAGNSWTLFFSGAAATEEDMWYVRTGCMYGLVYGNSETEVITLTWSEDGWASADYATIFVDPDDWDGVFWEGIVETGWVKEIIAPAGPLRPVSAKIFLNGSEIYTEASIEPSNPDDVLNTLGAEYRITFSALGEVATQSGLSIGFSDEDGTFEVTGSDIECYINSGTQIDPVYEWVTYSSSIDPWRISGCRSSAGRCDPTKAYEMSIMSFM